VNVSVIHIATGHYVGERLLGNAPASYISPLLDNTEIHSVPELLSQPTYFSSLGSKIYSDGFILESAEALSLLQHDARNANVVFQYLNGDDINSSPEQEPSRWVINFSEMSE